jgi:hypothetical protein
MRGMKIVHLSVAMFGLLSACCPAFAWEAEALPAPSASTTSGASGTTAGAALTTPPAQLRTAAGTTNVITDPASTIELRPQVTSTKMVGKTKYKRHTKISTEMAKYHWLDRAVAADPGLVAALCATSKGAEMLARHGRIAEIADADHYTCRRITKWRKAAAILALNPHVDHVITLDPEGIYRAIRRDPHIAYVLSKNPTFADMIDANPDLGNYIANHMY